MLATRKTLPLSSFSNEANIMNRSYDFLMFSDKLPRLAYRWCSSTNSLQQLLFHKYSTKFVRTKAAPFQIVHSSIVKNHKLCRMFFLTRTTISQPLYHGDCFLNHSRSSFEIYFKHSTLEISSTIHDHTQYIVGLAKKVSEF